MKLLYENDAPLAPLRGRKVAVLGYGNQGHAHALNLRDSGIDVVVGARRDGAGGHRAAEAGFEVQSFEKAASADLVIVALPDEVQPEIYDRHVAPRLQAGQCLGFVHGFNVHFQIIRPSPKVDVVMVAPKGPGHALRASYEGGGGLPGLIAVAQEATGSAREIALAWAAGIGCGRAGILQSTFARECVTDLFGEQAVLCGGIIELMKSGVQTLIDAGYPPEMAYFECVHEVKLIVDLIIEGGIEQMRQRISTTARYGGLIAGPRIIDERVRATLALILKEIETGQFARDLRREYEAGWPLADTAASAERQHAAVAAGQVIRQITKPK